MLIHLLSKEHFSLVRIRGLYNAMASPGPVNWTYGDMMYIEHLDSLDESLLYSSNFVERSLQGC